ncbi:MAG TPA: glycoside hydrolase family 27 protein [Corynebacteriales bacterium]|nr:glycoside hydrolase family 27 protein [Mycobacteriales bacterium]
MGLPRIPQGAVAAATGLLTLGLLLQPVPAQALENGLARTPPMGWNTWNAFRCDIDQWKIKGMADAIVETGLRDAGYVYLNVDDCWQAPQRKPNGELTWDKERFPDGILALARYVHSKGLKFGLYATPGSRGCANIWDDYPGKTGSIGHEYQDARTFARWGVDYLKYDWCKADEDGLTGESAFGLMRDAIQATGRPMVYSIHHEPELPVRDWYPKVSNLWRTTGDINDHWFSIARISLMTIPIAHHSRPGAWNDPDMLEIGNGGLNYAESVSHMTLWSMLAAPLLLGNDIRTMKDQDIAIVTNRLALRVDQDRLGKAAHRVKHFPHLVLARPLTNGEWAVSFTNYGSIPARISVTLEELGLTGNWVFEEAFSGRKGAVKNELASTVVRHSSNLYVLRPVS